MKELINYCPVLNYVQEIEDYPGKLVGYCQDNSLDGIEVFLYGDKPIIDLVQAVTVGAHLKFWPSWMDFWRGDEYRLTKLFPNSAKCKEYYLGAENKEQWLDVIRKNIKASLLLEPEYLVWHVAEADFQSIYTCKFAYSSAEVLQATVEVMQELADCIPKNVKILFENLWWPGLRLTEPLLAGKFFEAMARLFPENMGIMLDTGHLMNTNPELKTEGDGISYLLEVGKNLGSLKELVQGFHLSCSLSGEYQKQSLARSMSKQVSCFSSDSLEVLQHITSIDQHKPFKEARLEPLLDFYKPSYVNNELYYDTMEQLAGYLRIQRSRH